MCAVAVAAVAAVVALPMVAAAQTTTTFVPGEGAPPSPGDCSFTVTPLNPTAFPALLTVSGTTPTGQPLQVVVTYQLDGQPNATTVGTQDLPDGGDFSLSFTASGAGTVAVNYLFGNKNAYTTGCSGVGAVTVVRSVLAFTGSNDTPSLALIGTVAVVVGLVLVVAVRRRSQVANRS